MSIKDKPRKHTFPKKKRRADFLFGEGEFRQRIVEVKKRKRVEQLREKEILEYGSD